MRYIGNKTRLLPFIRKTIARLELPTGTAHDAFAGTAAVGCDLKRLGWRVISSDLMTYSYVFQQAYVATSRVPSFRALFSADTRLRRLASERGSARDAAGRLALLGEYLSNVIAPESGFISRNFSEAAGRMYFTNVNAGRIDAARRLLEEWRHEQLISPAGYFMLLAALIEAADRVANTAGVYAAYIKKWQPNARRSLSIEPQLPVAGPAGKGHRADAVDVARAARGVDLLYLDPPYNARQYAGYYHVPEIIARGWFGEELMLRGKTGLLEDRTLQSDWCSPGRVSGALAELLSATTARHVLVSYNSEGLLPSGDLRAALKDAAVDGKVRLFRKGYKRYRADSDRAGRRYSGDSVEERLFYARLPGREGE